MWRRLPVDGKGRALPWLTYPAIRFLEGRIGAGLGFRVLEFGSGNSTIWLSDRVESVYSVEHDLVWYNKFRRMAKLGNVVYMYRCLRDYAVVAGQFKGFDLVIIDGVDRVRCSRNAVLVLNPGGVIVWDDSEREQYQDAFRYLEGEGFRRLDFWGLAPGVSYERCTSVFYRSDNCLGI